MLNGLLSWYPEVSSWDADPCPTCGEKVTGFTATSGIYGFKTTVQPCNHEVIAVKINHMDTTHSHLSFKKSELVPELLEPLLLGQYFHDQINGLENYVPYQGPSAWPSSWNAGPAVPPGPTIFAQLLRSCPSLGDYAAVCPECPDSMLPLGGLVQHINDTHKWPREKIADWLETLDVDLTIQRVKESV